MSKNTELMLALWPNANNRQHWHHDDTSHSMWLSIRCVEMERTEDGMHIELDHYGIDGNTTRDVGLWLWASTGFSCNVELKAHDIYSASAFELTRLAKWLTKMNTKIAKADIPNNFGVVETLVLTLRAMGIKQAIEINPDWSAKPQYKIHSLAGGLKLNNYASPLAEMEAMRLRPYGDTYGSAA